MDLTGVDIIVNAVVGKSLRSQDGCNEEIFAKVKERVHKEVSDLVAKGHEQLDIILLQKKRLQAMFCGEKLLYEALRKKDVAEKVSSPVEMSKEVKKEKTVHHETKKYNEKEKDVKKEKDIPKVQEKVKENKKHVEKVETNKTHENEVEMKDVKSFEKGKEIQIILEKDKESRKSLEKEKETKKSCLTQSETLKKKPFEKGKEIQIILEKEKESRKSLEKEKETKKLAPTQSETLKKLAEIEKGAKMLQELQKKEKEVLPNGEVPHEEKAVEVQKPSKQYFEYLAEYKNDPDVYDRVKGMEIRGKGFPMSNDGSCPRCSFKQNAFVVLDFLFPAGDMPEILHYLLTLGKAVLWSSKQTLSFKDPPIFLCQGKCPSDIGKCGFNINWRFTDLEKIFLFPEQNYKSKMKGKGDTCSKNGDTSKANNRDSASEDEYDEGDVDIRYYKNKVSWVVLDEITNTGSASRIVFDEEAVIRTMLALEEARQDFTNGDMKKINGYELSQASTGGNTDNKPGKDSIKRKKVFSSSISNPKVKGGIEQISINYSSSRAPLLPNSSVSSVRQSSVLSTSATTIPPSNVASATTIPLSNVTTTKTNQIVYQPVQKTNTPSQHKKEGPSIPTPTHVFKGATYYNENKQAAKPAFTVHDFPISKDGACPYCHSSDVVYIILQEDGDTEELPQLLVTLHLHGKAVKRKKGEYDLPSFQCKGCTYGFNLDWKSTNLETIFAKSLSAPPPVSSYAGQNTFNNYNQQSNNFQQPYNNTANPCGQYGYNPYQQQQTAMMMNAYNYMQPTQFAIQAMIASALTSPYMPPQYGMNRMPNNFSKPPPPAVFPTQTLNTGLSGLPNNQYNYSAQMQATSYATVATSSVNCTTSISTSATSAASTPSTGSTTSAASTTSSSTKFSMKQLINKAYEEKSTDGDVVMDETNQSHADQGEEISANSNVPPDPNVEKDGSEINVDSSELYDPFNDSTAADSSELYDPLIESSIADSSELKDNVNEVNAVQDLNVEDSKTEVDSSELYDPFMSEKDAEDNPVSTEDNANSGEECQNVTNIESDTTTQDSVSLAPILTTGEHDNVTQEQLELKETIVDSVERDANIEPSETNLTSKNVVNDIVLSEAIEDVVVKPVRKTSTRGRRSSTRKTRLSKGTKNSLDDEDDDEDDIALSTIAASIIDNKNVKDINENEDKGIDDQTECSEILPGDDNIDNEVTEEEIVTNSKKGVKRKAPTRTTKGARGRGKGKKKK